MNKKISETQPIRTQLRNMRVGDVLFFPASKLSVLRTTCSGLGFEMGGWKYSVRQDKARYNVVVTRNR